MVLSGLAFPEYSGGPRRGLEGFNLRGRCFCFARGHCAGNFGSAQMVPGRNTMKLSLMGMIGLLGVAALPIEAFAQEQTGRARNQSLQETTQATGRVHDAIRADR